MIENRTTYCCVTLVKQDLTYACSDTLKHTADKNFALRMTLYTCILESCCPRGENYMLALSSIYS